MSEPTETQGATPIMPQTPNEQLAEYIVSNVSDRVIDHHIAYGELTIITDAPHVLPLLQFLRDDERCKFTKLMDVTGVDFLNRVKRFEVVYHLLSITKNIRIRVKVPVSENVAVPSAIDLFPAAGWFEREVWDMYGVPFAGHRDLRRILTDYGFDGHPQRKDFPLTGFVEMRYDETQKRVIYEPVKLQQAFRSFDFESPWEGMDTVIPRTEAELAAKREAK